MGTNQSYIIQGTADMSQPYPLPPATDVGGEGSLGKMLLAKSPPSAPETLRSSGKSKDEGELVKDTSLGGVLYELLRDAVKYKNESVGNSMLEDYYARQSRFTVEEENLLESIGGSSGSNLIYISLTQSVCSSLKSWMISRVFPNDRFAWDIRPTTEPSLPADVGAQVVVEVLKGADELLQQRGTMPSGESMAQMVGAMNEEIKRELLEKAKDRCKSAKMLLQDQLQEGNWTEAVSDFVDHFCTTSAAFLVGPYKKKREKLAWVGENGKARMVEEVHWESPHPLDVYPLAGSRKIDELGVFRRIRLTESGLLALRGMSGVCSNKKINDLLKTYRGAGFRDPIFEEIAGYNISGLSSSDDRDVRQEGQNEGSINVIDGVEFTGRIPIRMLGKEFEGDDTKLKLVRVLLVQSTVVRVELLDEAIGMGWYASSFRKRAESIWGESPPAIIRDKQRMVNALATALANDAISSSGPQVIVNDAEALKSESTLEYAPFKVWLLDAKPGLGLVPTRQSSTKPIEFYKPALNTNELLQAIDYFRKQAIEELGVNLFPFSGLSGAAQRTASGLEAAIGQSNQQQSNPLKNLDDAVEKALESLYALNIMENKRGDIKGDVRCIAMASHAEIVKEQKMVRLIELLNATANPMDMQLLGAHIRKSIYKKLFMDMGFSDLANEVMEEAADDQRMEQQLSAEQGVMEGSPSGEGRRPPGPNSLDGLGNQLGGKRTANI